MDAFSSFFIKYGQLKLKNNNKLGSLFYHYKPYQYREIGGQSVIILSFYDQIRDNTKIISSSGVFNQ